MMILENGSHIFIGDIIDIQSTSDGTGYRGKIVEFYTKVYQLNSIILIEVKFIM